MTGRLASAESVTNCLVFPTMGTMASLRVPGGVPSRVGEAVVALFAEVEARFTLQHADSEARLVSDRRLPFHRASQAYQAAYWTAHDWMTRTDGAFAPFRYDGTVDLYGVVKALAMAQAADLLGTVDDWCLHVGGDVLVHGETVVGGTDGVATPWVAGVVDPRDRGTLVSQAILSAELPAIATSGTSERGEHVWRRDESRAFSQVSVLAEDIVTADVLATAILSGGVTTLEKATSGYRVEVLAFDRTGRVWATPAFRRG